MGLQNTYETASEKDLPDMFSVNVEDNVLTATRSDPYGFWRFSFKRGRLPAVLEGDFAGELKARQALNAYLATKQKV